MNLPAFQFYPKDWLSDPALRCCSEGARGVWIDILCFAFDCDVRGILRLNGIILDEKRLAKAIGIRVKFIEELIENGVLRRAKRTGAFYSKRMLLDELKRQRLARNGKKGGATSKQTVSKPEAKREQSTKQIPPSSSSSSSSSSFSSSIPKQEATQQEAALPLEECDPRDDSDSDWMTEVRDSWNTQCADPAHLPFQRCDTLGYADMNNLANLYRYPEFRDGYGAVFKRVAESTFLRSGGSRGEIFCTLSWVLSKERFHEILEGKYDDKQQNNRSSSGGARGNAQGRSAGIPEQFKRILASIRDPEQRVAEALRLGIIPERSSVDEIKRIEYAA